MRQTVPSWSTESWYRWPPTGDSSPSVVPTRSTDALDGVTGHRLWRHEGAAGVGTSSSPTQLVTSPDAELTYLDDDGAVGAVDQSGGERWMVPGLRPVGVAEGFLVTVGTGGGSLRQEVVLAVVELRTGAEVWRKTVPGFDAAVVAGAIVVADQTNGTATDLSDHDATISAYAAVDGAEQWSVATALAVELFPAGDLALGRDDGRRDARGHRRRHGPGGVDRASRQPRSLRALPRG